MMGNREKSSLIRELGSLPVGKGNWEFSCWYYKWSLAVRGLKETSRDICAAHSNTLLLLADYLYKMPNIKVTIPWALKGKTSSQFVCKDKCSLTSQLTHRASKWPGERDSRLAEEGNCTGRCWGARAPGGGLYFSTKALLQLGVLPQTFLPVCNERE